MSQTKLWGTNVLRIPTEQEFEDMMLRSRVHCMASGQVEDQETQGRLPNFKSGWAFDALK